MGRNHSNEINELITRAKEQIWKYQKHLDMGRYYNTLGNIALNQKRLEEAQSEFSQAFEYSESFEVEAQTLLGMTKVNLEFFLITDNSEFLSKAELFLSDLRLAARSSALILGEVDLILGIINMYKNHFGKADVKFNQVINHAQTHEFSSLAAKALEQQEILQVMQSHEELQQIIISSKKSQIPQIKPIKEVIDYLNELMKLVSSQTTDKRSRNQKI
jgi:tetratricopeptide (TPR) repeat protein